jgi:hypothetical protein
MSAVAEEAEEETGEGVACGEAVESAGSGAAIITGAAEAEEAEEAEEADAAGVEGSTSCLVTWNTAFTVRRVSVKKQASERHRYSSEAHSEAHSEKGGTGVQKDGADVWRDGEFGCVWLQTQQTTTKRHYRKNTADEWVTEGTTQCVSAYKLMTS